MPTELRIKKTRSKVNTLDIIVRSKDKRVINVELNSNYDKITKERNLGYYTSIFSQNILRGEEKISETIQVNLNFNGSKKGKGKEVYYIKERQSGKIYSKKFKIICVNIAKYKEECYDEVIKGRKEHIYLVALGSTKEELEKISKKDKLVKEVKEKLFILNDNETYTRLISEEEEAKMIEEARMKMVKEEGRQEEKKENAKRMLSDGLDIVKIEEYTGLSEQEIKKLIEE